VLLGEVGDLRVGQLQAPRDVIGVFEQDLTGAREPQPAAPAVEQTDADLGLE
jgi:hypothetical protein